MALGVEADDLELEHLALMHHITRVGDALVRELADVDQTFEALADPYEGAEVHQLGDRTVDHIADLEVSDGRLPRIGLEATDRQADPTPLVVDVDDLGLNLVADLVARLGVVDLVPRELALVDEAVDAAEVDEDAERRDRPDAAGDLLSHLEAAEQLVPLFAALFVESDLLGQDEPVGLAVDLEDLEAELAADVRLQLLRDLLGGVSRLLVLRATREVHDLGDRHEAADAAVDDQAALVVVDDRGVDDRAGLELLLHRAPLALKTGAAEREDHVALRGLRLQHVHEHNVADGELRSGLGIAAEELAVADHALGLRADVDQDLILVDPDDGALDDVSMLEALDVRVLLGEELLHGCRFRAQRLPGEDDDLFLFLHGCGRCVGKVVLCVNGRLRCGLGCRLRCGLGCRLRCRLRCGLGGDGLVDDGGRLDGLLGRRGVAGGDRLLRRRGPALLLFGQGDPVSFGGFRPGNHERPPSHTRGRQREGDGSRWCACGPLLRVSTSLGACSSTVRARGPGESSTPAARVQSLAVPELPDLDVVVDALHASLVGRPVEGVRAQMPLTVRGTPAELDALAGQRVVRIARVGKFLDVILERDVVTVNPMLTGRFQLAGAGQKAPPGMALEFAFGERDDGPPPDAAPWTGGAAWIPGPAAEPFVRYRDPTQMGKVYLLPAGVERPVPGRGPGEMGPDALDPALTVEAWRERIRKHPGELKNLLRNQAFVAGIGNAYSDEVLFAARLQPFRKRFSLASEEVDELYRAMRLVLTDAVGLLRRRVPPTFEKQVRDHLSTHNRGGEPCPRCGTKITVVRAGGFPTGFCRGCQR